MRARRILLVAAIATGLPLVLPAVAFAHAGLLSSTPQAGSELASAPGAVILRFSEPVNERLSTTSVIEPDGNHVAGSVLGTEEMAVQLGGHTPGVYRVSWTTVSLLDGHTLTGSFAFGVGVPIGADAGSASSSRRRTSGGTGSLAGLSPRFLTTEAALGGAS